MENLLGTAEMMNSSDYKERFKAEYYQVVIRYKKLKAMLEKWDKGELNFNPTCPRSIYNMQIRAMTDYIAVLEARAVIEGVELKNSIQTEEGKMKDTFKNWIKAAGVRAVKTVAQTAVATIGTSAVLGDVNWVMVASASALAGVLSLLTSVAGLPEVED